MAYTFVRDGVIYVRWKNAPDRRPKWPAATEDPETGLPWRSEKRAKEWGRQQEVKAKLGLLDDPEEEEAEADALTGQSTLAAWFAQWWTSLDVGLKSHHNYAYYFRAYILPEWGGWRLCDIRASDVNAWEKRLIDAGYERNGVPAGARTRLTTLLSDAVTEGLIPSNPAVRQRHRGRRSGVRTGGRGADKPVLSSVAGLRLAERLGIMSGRDEEFVLGLLIVYGGVRYGEGIGLQRQYMRPAGIRIDWQLGEIDSRWYLLPPKDDSNRDIDLPPIIHDALTALIASHPERRCACQPETVEGQREQPCEGGKPFIFVGPRGGHPRNGNFSSRYWIPAADGRYPTPSGERSPSGRPVTVDLGSAWPGVPIAGWPRAVPGELYERPRMTGYGRRPPRLGVNVASSRAQLVAFAIEQGVPEVEANAMTRVQIIDRFIRSQYLSADTPVASWLPVLDGVTPHEARHAHSTLLHGLRTPMKLRDDRMGHVSPEMRGMRDLYTDILPEWRSELRADLQKVVEEALAQRAWFGLRSPVRMLDRWLEPFRDGRKKPVSPMPSRAEIIPLAAGAG